MKTSKVTVIIPNYNGKEFLEPCLKALDNQTFKDFDILIVDNGSTDDSIEWIKEKQYPLVQLGENKGFAGGVNVGIKLSLTPYVILLNNDTEVLPEFVKELVESIEKSEKIFSVSSCMMQYNNHELMDDAGDGMSLPGWAYQIGVGENVKRYQNEKMIFSACAGAAIYRRNVFDKIGLFDEMHFAYLEDIDIGYRAKINGYFNLYEPKAKVYHVGSGTSGSKYNPFKVRLASRNNIYLLYKNQADWQLIINFIPIILGILVKGEFFRKKGFLKDYVQGIFEGLSTYKQCTRIKFSRINPRILLAIEWELISGTVKYIYHFLYRKSQ